jgi:uncharacterized protein
MHFVARLLLNRFYSWAVVTVVGLISLLSLYGVSRVQNEDDLLAFLPRNNPDVKTFYEINTHFGSLEVALVGIEAEDPFQKNFLEKLKRVTQNLKETRGLNYVLSLANVTDFTADEQNGGIVTAPLLESIPGTPEGIQALRKKVFSKDHVVGNLISSDGKAVLVYCFLAYGTDPRSMSSKIRSLVSSEFPDHRIEWGGNPFVSSYVYDTVQKDLRRLTPWAVLVIVLLMLLALQDVKGTALALLSTGAAIGVTVGLMGFLGVRLNLMLGAMPIVLFAIGCAYSIHVLSRYYDWRQKNDTTTSLFRTLCGIGPVVLAAGITSAAAILSFVVMDIQPIRSFGLFTSIGILITMTFSLTLVPAVIFLFDLHQRTNASIGPARRWMVRLAVFVQARRLPVGISLLVVAAICGLLIGQIKTGVDQSSFFSEGSPPDRADKFLREHFGAAQFIQLQVEGDMTHPAVLRELQSLADRLELVKHVTGVQHVGQVLSTINEAMSGQRRIPNNRDQVNNLYTFLIGDPSVRQLVTDDRNQALMQIKVDTSKAEEITPVLEEIQHLVTEEHLDHYQLAQTTGARASEVRSRKESQLLFRLSNLAHRMSIPLRNNTRDRLQAFLGSAARETDPRPVREALSRFLRSSECAVPLPPPTTQEGDVTAELAEKLTNLGPKPSEDAIRTAVRQIPALATSVSMVEDLALTLITPVENLWIEQQVAQRAHGLLNALELKPGLPGEESRLERAVSMALLDADQPDAVLPAANASQSTGQLTMRVNGLPVLHRGLAHSVEKNQIGSLTVAVLLVILILSAVFRSFKTGLLASLPTLFTLVIIHGIMGLFRINLDIGTSLLGSLILANGVDYAVHLIAAWETPPGGSLARAAACAADQAGPAIWTTAATMFVGFFVLSLGEARPLQNVTGLKAAAMLVGALSSFLLIPILARKNHYEIYKETSDCRPPYDAAEDVLLEETSTER